MSVRKLQQRRGWAFSVLVGVVKPTLLALTRHRWIDGHHIPAEGGCVVVVNHLSHIDPLTAAHLVYDHGRIPRYLAKSGLFGNRALGGFLRSAGQIPVERASRNARGAYAAAVDAVRAGECVVVYPEGTITRDPDLWPMTGKSGAARIALATGCPVVPVGQWGPQDLLAPYARKPDLLPRKLITMKVGPPLQLADLVDGPVDGPVDAQRVARATDRIIDAITALVADIRGEQPPAQRYDLRRDQARSQAEAQAQRDREDGAS